jgi:hypothetical protein
VTELETELAHRAARGLRPVSVVAMGARLATLGYALDRNCDCFSQNLFMTGEREGQSYPAINTGVKERDTGRSAFHFEARRDENFKELQRLRAGEELFAVVKNRILEI